MTTTQTAPAVQLDREAVAAVLVDYRRYRTHEEPYYAARTLANGWARYLADQVVDGKYGIDFATPRYLAARVIKAAVVARAAVGEKKWVDMNDRERYWQTGKLAVNR